MLPFPGPIQLALFMGPLLLVAGSGATRVVTLNVQLLVPLFG